MRSRYFEDEGAFPRGSAAFDCALLMRGVEHEWHAREELCCAGASLGEVRCELKRGQ